MLTHLSWLRFGCHISDLSRPSGTAMAEVFAWDFDDHC